MRTAFIGALAVNIFILFTCGLDSQAAEVTTPTILFTPRLHKTITTTPTLDNVYRLSARDWHRAGKREWVSPRVKTDIPFNELIYYWRVRIPRDEGFRLFLQAEFPDKTVSPWLYAGYWGTVSYVENRRIPEFDRGKLDYDQLLLTTPAVSFRFKLLDDGKKPLSVKPELGVLVTLNDPGEAFAGKVAKAEKKSTAPGIIHDVPLRLQVDTAGNKLIDRCQSAALASAMQYFGTTVPLEQIICWTTDPEYQSFGIWPRTIGAAHELGFDAYLDRFRDWDKVRDTVAQNKIILCSITMPPNDNYLAPPYRKMSGHIVALCGVTDDNRVVVVDSAISKQNRGYLVQWLMPDFEKIWMRNKGGVGMVICPPPGFKPKLVKELPAFPRSVGTVGWADDEQTTPSSL
ncbi:MAG: C39 family peptidase [Candidatus Sumerlaeaceae bacterium]|nr:C39 family peptidase [Candidatus Sumerlaeaceae bacterium]